MSTLLTDNKPSFDNKLFKVPSFYIYTPDRKRVSTLVQAFIKKLDISTETYKQGSFVAYDIKWRFVVDASHKDKIEKELAHNNGIAHCIVSFQTHSYGKFAIIRLHEKKDFDE